MTACDPEFHREYIRDSRDQIELILIAAELVLGESPLAAADEADSDVIRHMIRVLLCVDPGDTYELPRAIGQLCFHYSGECGIVPAEVTA